jgi:hypothetical protein
MIDVWCRLLNSFNVIMIHVCIRWLQFCDSASLLQCHEIQRQVVYFAVENDTVTVTAVNKR